ncbi:MFS transporter, partial [Shigella dysenteriae]|nr:MFS transporter [Shigella dysenteriae]EFX6401666.1 MFS transporter [Shigella boydii]EFX6529593.1 MFS transporter [Shigella dysenteriae]EFX9651528.1 MFS transporter [Shigella dysenteriae]EGE2239229.1 MFS transporter [Shigella dysenteriae]
MILWYRTHIRCWLLCGNTTSQFKRCYGTFFLSIRNISLSKYLLKNPHVYPIRLPL